MSFSFQNQGYNTFLCYEVDSDKEIDSLTLGMLTNNKIYGFAQTTFSQVNEKRYLNYNVTSKVSAKQFFAGIINKKKILSVFSGIAKAYLTADEYMLDVSKIILDLDYMFVDVSTSDISLICLPVIDLVDSVDIKMFFKNILLNSQFDQSENGDYFAKLLNYFNSSDEINFEQFNDLLNSLNNSKDPVYKEQNNNAFSRFDNRAVSTTPGYTNVSTNPNNYNHTGVINTVPSDQNPIVNKQAVQNQRVPVSAQINTSSNPPVNTPYVNSVSNNGVAYQRDVVIPQAPAPVSAPAPAPVSVPVVKQKADNKANDNKGKDKKSGGMFGFLNKEKKDKPQKNEKKSNKKVAANSSNNDAFANIAIPGQVVPPTVKAAPSKEPIMSVPYTNNQNAQAATTNAQYMHQTNNKMNPVQHNDSPINIQVPNVAVNRNTTPVNTNMMNFGETTVLGGGSYGETTVLGLDNNALEPLPHLIRLRNHERIDVNKPVFRIGKEKSYVDYFIADNTAISRSHANIITRDNAYFVIDTNSTNHTFVDGKMIPSNSEIEIVNGSKIRFANEDFEFNIY